VEKLNYKAVAWLMDINWQAVDLWFGLAAVVSLSAFYQLRNA
jgi:hypothetical protein